MTTALYKKGAQSIFNKEIDLDTDTIKCSLMKNDYAQNLSADDFYNDISASVLATVTMTGKTITDGVFDADDVTFSAVAGGSTAEAVVIWKDTGNVATSNLICYYDAITGFPIATNGGDITVQWDSGSSKIFAITS